MGKIKNKDKDLLDKFVEEQADFFLASFDRTMKEVDSNINAFHSQICGAPDEVCERIFQRAIKLMLRRELVKRRPLNEFHM